MAKNSDKQAPRSDTKQPSKAKQKDKEYLEYQRYIRSKEWKAIKEIVLERDHHQCQFCGATAEERNLSVHHKTYEHLYDEKEHLDDLITICSIDHKMLHSVKANYKRFSRKKNKDKNGEE